MEDKPELELRPHRLRQRRMEAVHVAEAGTVTVLGTKVRCLADSYVVKTVCGLRVVPGDEFRETWEPDPDA